MNDIPTYRVRGVAVKGFPNEAAAVEHLFTGPAPRTGLLIAVNAEKVIATERDAAFRALVESAAYTYADGISIVRSIRRKYSARLQRIPGCDLWQAIMQRASRDSVPVFLIGGRPEVLHTVAEKLRANWTVNIVGRQHGYFAEHERAALQEQVRRSGAAIVTVALGSPAQEQFMQECHRTHPDALYMGVGGTFDVFAGAVHRAPPLWRRLGFEWLYRVLSQPTRVGRITRLLKYATYHYTGRL